MNNGARAFYCFRSIAFSCAQPKVHTDNTDSHRFFCWRSGWDFCLRPLLWQQILAPMGIEPQGHCSKASFRPAPLSLTPHRCLAPGRRDVHSQKSFGKADRSDLYCLISSLLSIFSSLTMKYTFVLCVSCTFRCDDRRSLFAGTEATLTDDCERGTATGRGTAHAAQRSHHAMRSQICEIKSVRICVHLCENLAARSRKFTANSPVFLSIYTLWWKDFGNLSGTWLWLRQYPYYPLINSVEYR